jgi:hypothetical protein
MAPRIKVTAVLSCDPSWRGLAFILHVPSMDYNRSFLYDLKEYDKSKQYKNPTRTTKIIQQVLDDLFEKEPRMMLVDKIVMESQHKINMQVLSWLLVANILPRVGQASVEYVSPLAWKANFGIALTGTHKGNKAAAEKFVEDSKNRLVASETVTENNTADACLVLNSYLETTKNTIKKNIDDWSSMANLVTVSSAGNPGTKLICPKCKQKTGVVRLCTDETKKNYNKHFLTCWWTHNKGSEGEKKCGNFKALYSNVPKIVDGYVDKTWRVVTGDEDDDVVEVVKQVGTKRPLPPKSEPAPAAKRTMPAAPPPRPVSDGLTTSNVSAILGAHIKVVFNALKVHIDKRFDEMTEYMKKQEIVAQQVSEMREILDNIINAQQQQETDQEPEAPAEETEDISQGANDVTTADELEEISKLIEY